jgi:hypothetical protein
MEQTLEQWLVAAAEAAGVPPDDVTRLDADLVTAILDLARDAARGVERPAAPLAAFALGLSMGRAHVTDLDVSGRCARVAARAASWTAGA